MSEPRGNCQALDPPWQLEVGEAELLTHWRDRLAPYKLPRGFERVSEPLRDDAGKVRRSAFRVARMDTAPPAGASFNDEAAGRQMRWFRRASALRKGPRFTGPTAARNVARSS